VAEVLLKRYGRSYCEELGIPIERNTPSLLFRWLCATVLFSIRISANLAVRGAKALTEHGLDDAGEDACCKQAGKSARES
jgi:hypothetical protein